MTVLSFNRIVVGMAIAILNFASGAESSSLIKMMRNYMSSGSFRSTTVESQATRSVVAVGSSYWETTDFGLYNPMVAIGNPMKGLTPNPRWNKPPFRNNIPYSLEHYYVGLDTVMIGDNVFNWTSFEVLLNEAKARQNHVIPRFHIHFPNNPLRLPSYLYGKVKLVQLSSQDVSPDYNDPILQAAIKQFIVAYATKYDGDQRIFCIQMGLLGFWGEWHTSGYNYLLPEAFKDEILILFDNLFNKTQVQTRYPRISALNKPVGFYDDSFTYSTLSGIPNGGAVYDWFFWNLVEKTTNVNFWKHSNMGGETRPENQLIVFRPDYQNGTSNKQSFDLCTKVTHATWMLMQGAFTGTVDDSYVTNALHSHSLMGYNYMIRKIAASTNVAQTSFVDITVTIQQKGVAPFYYPLNLVMTCPGMVQKQVPGVEKLIDQNSIADFVIFQVPATTQCLSNVTLNLNSPLLYPGKFVKLAQSNNTKVTTDGMVRLSIPLPIIGQPAPTTVQVPVSGPIRQPTRTPTMVQVPVRGPTGRPTRGPTRRPTRAPTRPPTGVVNTTTTMPFFLFNANANSFISQLRNGDTIFTSSTGNQLCIVAELLNVPTGTTIGSILFEWTEYGTFTTKRESFPPYVLPGNVGTDYYPFQYLQYPGSKSVHAIAYSSTGAVLRNRMINFTVV
jgi:hypothetical protein